MEQAGWPRATRHQTHEPWFMQQLLPHHLGEGKMEEDKQIQHLASTFTSTYMQTPTYTHAYQQSC